MSKTAKTYLGDGAFAEFDGFAIVLTAENGMAVTNRVVLEPEVYRALLEFVAQIAKRENTDFPTVPSNA